jgi:O-antigen/teichoic acid export membrane protein
VLPRGGRILPLSVSRQHAGLAEPDFVPGLPVLVRWNRKHVPNNLNPESKSLQARALSGSFLLLSASGLATAINFAYNIALARFLGPTGFGQATAVYTLLILLLTVTLSFQIVSAKAVAQQSSPEGKLEVHRSFHRSAWICGIVVALLLLLFQKAIADFLNLPSPILIVLLAIGAAFYVPLGSQRGYLQGAYGFPRLAMNIILEALVRLCGSLLLIKLGFGVPGVIAANAAAVAAAYFATGPRFAAALPTGLCLPDAFREVLQAVVFCGGQALINNCDIVLVKHFFPATAAGLYAAVSLVGRVIFFFCYSVVNSMFPLMAGARREERHNHKLLATSLLVVLGIGSTLALGLRLAPAGIWTSLFGAQFEIAGKHGLPYLLALYATATVIYSLSVVMITYEMSYKIANTSWVQLAFSGVVVAGICRYHSSLRQVIWVQLVVMSVLFVVVAVPFLVNVLKKANKLQVTAGSQSIRIIRRVSEAEVIAEFLKNDFNKPAFEEYQEVLHGLVTKPDLDDVCENAKRRALLFIRYLSLWSELPKGTEWFEVDVRAADLGQILVFPRARWRKLARGNFAVPAVVERIRMFDSVNVVDDAFLSKIAALRDWLRLDIDPGAVLLIGLSENEPVTILDGNHRLVAATLTSPLSLHRFRFLCGLSPRMTECCWYRTNIATLFRYGTNLLTQAVHDPEAELTRLLQRSR